MTQSLTDINTNKLTTGKMKTVVESVLYLQDEQTKINDKLLKIIDKECSIESEMKNITIALEKYKTILQQIIDQFDF